MRNISVITPVFNREEYIGDCVRSVGLLNTNGQFHVEHVVVDDGSTDGTVEKLNQLAIEYPNLKVVVQEQNKGQSAARNTGISQAEGDDVFFLDSDDLLFQNSLYGLYLTLESSRAVWVYGDFVRCDIGKRYLPGQDYWGWQFADTKEALVAMYSGKHFFQHSFLVKKELLEKVGGYDETLRMAEDFDLCTRFLLAGENPLYVPGALYAHRFHTSNLSGDLTAHPEKHLDDVRTLFQKYKNQFPAEVTNKIL